MTSPALPTPTRAGFVALVGIPNAGKSTLTNQLTGQHLSIVTPKAQTTRFAVRAIHNHGASQMVLVDTPGMFRPKTGDKARLDRAMVAAAATGAEEADILLLLVDVTRPKAAEETAELLSQLGVITQPMALVLNKIDLLPKAELIARVQPLAALHGFDRVFMISAETGDGVKDLEQWLAASLPESPWLYPEDQAMDMSERLLAAELTREQLMLRLEQEVPYGLTVETERWEEGASGVKIWQVIVVEREAHKKIILGKQGALIRAIGQTARQQITRQIGRKAHLFLHVKCREGWKNNPEHYQYLGLDFN